MPSKDAALEKLFNISDIHVLFQVKCFQNNPAALMKICLPPLLSLAFCPVSLFLFDPMADFFWSPLKFEMPPKINDVISAFLVPAGLVYAISFGFALQAAIENLHQAKHQINEHVTAVKQLALLVCESPVYTRGQKLEVLSNLKKSLIHWMKAKLMQEKVQEPHRHGTWSTRSPRHSLRDPLYAVVFHYIHSFSCFRNLENFENHPNDKRRQ